MRENIVMLGDSYKYSQPKQYPKNVVEFYGYMEARSSNVYPATLWFGMQYITKRYLQAEITKEDVYEAAHFAKAHGELFELDGWLYIASLGYLPLEICAVPEGSLIPNGNVLATFRSTDPKVPWLERWVETLIMKAWYMTTVATKSYYTKQMLLKYIKDPAFSYHNFGDRGATCVEAAAIGGMAHLTQLMGTDNFNSLRYVREYYNEPCAGFSIPASEHSTVTSWGRENEFAFYDNYIELYKDSPIVACVMDSYNIYDAVEYITTGASRTKIESDNYPIFVIRPDSGEPDEILRKLLAMLKQNVAYSTLNGVISFNKYRIIWGDGITPEVMEDMMNTCVELNIEPSMLGFGSGGDLMQNVNRDTLGFAIKCSNVTLQYDDPICKDGQAKLLYKERDVYKDPLHGNKKSKKGRITTYYNKNTDVYFVDTLEQDFEVAVNMLQPIFYNGQLLNETTFTEIRKCSQA